MESFTSQLAESQEETNRIKAAVFSLLRFLMPMYLRVKELSFANELSGHFLLRSIGSQMETMTMIENHLAK